MAIVDDVEDGNQGDIEVSVLDGEVVIFQKYNANSTDCVTLRNRTDAYDLITALQLAVAKCFPDDEQPGEPARSAS